MSTRDPRAWAITAAAVLVAASACRHAPAETPVVADPTSERTVQQGTLVGFTGRYGAHVWRGIPYAAPPVGPLRWRAPQAPASWTGTRPGLAEAPFCVQLPSVFGGVEAPDRDHVVGQEDCLYLNVFAPPSRRTRCRRGTRGFRSWSGSTAAGTSSDTRAATTAVRSRRAST